MNIVVIGLGSMGKRRIRLMRELYPKMTIYGVDRRNDRRKETEAIFGIESFASIEAINKDVDCAFVCTSPLSHSSIIRECLTRKWHTFTELNLVADGYCENMELAKKNSCHLFLSSTFYYREEIKYIQSQVQVGEKWNYMYHIGQYLPDWHPWENFKDFFVGKKETNGCREIFAIELPWLIRAFGEIESVNVLAGNNTDLNIDYQDNYLVLIKHKTGHKGMMAVDIMSRKAVRNFELFGEQIYITWDGSPMGLKEYNGENKEEKTITLYNSVDTLEGYSSFVIENAYENELRNFFEVVKGEIQPQYSFSDDLITLEWIDRIEER